MTSKTSSLVAALLERETGIEPATNSLEGCDSTIELLPPPQIGNWKAEIGKRQRLNRISLLPDSIFQFPAPGGQGRVRTSVDRMGRQIYSLLLLTTQPPVRNSLRRRPARTIAPLRSVFGYRQFEPSSSCLRLDAGIPQIPRKAEYFTRFDKTAPDTSTTAAG